MANVVRHKRGTSTPSASDFSNTGELLVDTNTGNVFNKTDGSSVVKVNGLGNVVEDTTPQLGGSLDVNGQDIVTTSNADIELAPNGTGKTVLKGNSNPGTLVFNCESNSHGQTVKSQPHSASVTNVLTLPAGGDQEIVGTVATQTLTSKTLTSPVLNTGVSGSAILDEDNMASNSATQLATQQSIKAYVDANAGGGGGSTSPGGSNTQVQFNNSGSFGGSANFTFDGTNATVAGTVSAVSPAVATAGLRKVHASTSAPSGSDGAVGDLWVKY